MNKPEILNGDCVEKTWDPELPHYKSGKSAYNPNLPDSGARIDYGTGAQREPATGKGRFDLLPPHALRRLALHFENGARKYRPRNWEHGLPCSRFVDSALRHLVEYLDGDCEEDHLAAAAWNVMCLIETEHRAMDGKLPVELLDLPRHANGSASVSSKHIDIPEPFGPKK